MFRSSHTLLNDRGGTPVATRRMRAGAGEASSRRRPRQRLDPAAPGDRRRHRGAQRGLGFDQRADAARFAILDSQDELRALFQHGAGMTGDVLPIFLVRGISSTAGLENAIGIAGGINGPPGIFGMVPSGVVDTWDNTFGRTDLLAQVLAHECGHYLGFRHTMECNPACNTAGQMDCSLWGGVDNLTDTPGTMAAAHYLTHWATSKNDKLLSAGQGLMMQGNPTIY